MKTVCETILSAPESEVPQGAFDFMAWMSGHLSVVPDDCRASARIRLMPVGDANGMYGPSVEVVLSYDRPLTPVEIEADNRTAEQLAAHVEKCKRIARGLPPVAVDPLPYAKLAEELRDILSAPPKYVAAREAMTVGYGVAATPMRLGHHTDGLFDSMVAGMTIRDLIDAKHLMRDQNMPKSDLVELTPVEVRQLNLKYRK